MLLALDIGNTNTDLGLFDQGRLTSHHKRPTPAPGSPDVWDDLVRSVLASCEQEPLLAAAAISSVVRDAADAAALALAPHCAGPVHRVDGRWDLGLSIGYDDPLAVGTDRLLAAAAAYARRADGCGAVVADVGTAITVDAVDPGGRFRGGAILPGMRVGLAALRSRTSLLPQVELSLAAPLLGTSTPQCMLAGAVHGSAAALDGLFDRFQDEVGGLLEGWLTGGDAPVLAPFLQRYRRHEPALVLHGLMLACRRSTGRG